MWYSCCRQLVVIYVHTHVAKMVTKYLDVLKIILECMTVMSSYLWLLMMLAFTPLGCMSSLACVNSNYTTPYAWSHAKWCPFEHTFVSILISVVFFIASNGRSHLSWFQSGHFWAQLTHWVCSKTYKRPGLTFLR